MALSDRSSLQAWIVCIAAGLFFMYDFIQLNMLNSLHPYLMDEYRVTATQMGHLSACFFYGTLLFLPGAGAWLDRFSPKKIMLIAMGICTIGALSFALSHTYWIAAFCRLFTGITSAFCFLCCIRIASHWFLSHQMAFVTGLTVTMAMIGGIIAQVPLTLLINSIGWRNALYVDAALGIFITFTIWHYIQDYPPNTLFKPKTTLNFWKIQLKAFSSIQNWLAGIYTCLLNQPIALLGALWGNVYLEKVHNLSLSQASSLTSMLFIGTIIGGPIAGYFSDKIRFRKFPMLLGSIFSLIVIGIILYFSILSFYKLLGLFFLLGFFSSTQVISYPLVTEMNPSSLTASSVSVVSFCAIAGYAIFQPLFGYLMDLHWNGTIYNGVPHYSIADYNYAILLLPITCIISFIIACFLRETHCQPSEE